MSIATSNPAATTTVTRDIGRVQEAVPGAIVAAEPSGLVIAPDRLVEVGTFLRDDPALVYDYLSMVDHNYEIFTRERLQTLLYDKAKLTRPDTYYAEGWPKTWAKEEATRRKKSP